MLKKNFTSALIKAIKKKDQQVVNTIRLILAVIKDKEISLRSSGDSDEITEDKIILLLRNMIKQRYESIKLYKKGKREELAKQEIDEIKIIEGFLRTQFTDNEIKAACKDIIIKLSANNIQDMGRVMNELKNQYASKIDMSKAGLHVKAILNSSVSE